MFDFDSLREIGATIKKNKLRTFLTGFSIAWGIFMLIILLGAGNGLKNGIESNFSRRAKNTISIWGGSTSVPYKGLPVDRNIKLDQEDLKLIRTQFEEVDYLSAQINRMSIISFNKEYGSWQMLGVHPDASYINNINILTGKGRFINNVDIEKKRKVIVINSEMEDILFGGQEALGKYVIAQDIAFLVIGVYKDETGRTNVPAYIPYSTALTLYSKDNAIDRIDFTISGLNTLAENEDFIERFRQKIGALHNFDPDDKSAISIWNTAEVAVQTAQILNTITLFIWVVGLFSMIAGVVGISNIMLITVKERTKEFGIRKAIGASPSSILRLVLLESIIVTALFGYLGMMLGVGITEIVNNLMEMSAQASEGEPAPFKNPTVNIGIVIQATIVLIVSGVVAGGIPALRAVRISPIEAMRSE